MRIFQSKSSSQIRQINAFAAAVFCLVISFSNASLGQGLTPESEPAAPETAPIIVDGNVLFRIRGASSITAEQRAKDIVERIVGIAENDTISTDSVKAIAASDRTTIAAGTAHIVSVFDTDAQAERLSRSVFAESVQRRIQNAIKEYRVERSRPVLLKKLAYAGVAALLLALILLLLAWSMRRVNVALLRRMQTKVNSVENKSFNLIRSAQIWRTLDLLFSLLRFLLIVFLVVIFINYVLGIFPWTKQIANYMLDVILSPLVSIGKGLVAFIPNLVFLIVIFLVTRYVLKLIHLFFAGIGDGSIVFPNFDPEWAMPTYRIVRTFVVIFSVVFAYPYIPGSGSEAFKGVSVFVGVLFSLGSSSVIGNLLAGYFITYRKVFKRGDRIQVDNYIGFVEEQKATVTKLRSLKNEVILLPNSTLMNSNIVNYSKGASNQGIILHTTVGIGYETPWRQVDAMLKTAANRTDGLLKEPAPFVLKASLGDFAVTYEINAYCNDPIRMSRIYNELHEHILDIFNENNVQIMTPAYEGDPEIPKVVPRDKWDTPLIGENR